MDLPSHLRRPAALGLAAVLVGSLGVARVVQHPASEPVVATRMVAATPAPPAFPADVDPHLLGPVGSNVVLAAPAGLPVMASPAAQRFAAAFPAQAEATQTPGVPASQRWALLIGINDHDGGPADNHGSRQDAEELRNHLLASGWRDDHIVLLTDRAATRETILQGMNWLATKTSATSTAVFHYAGHSKKWYGQDHDGDGEITDEALWPSDNRFIDDSEMVTHLAGVDAGAFWVNIAACESAGFDDPGLQQPGRVLTFSSTESQKSYEDPAVSNSVWGHYLIDQSLIPGIGDTDGDGNVSVEEAFARAAPQATTRTIGQRYGAQTPVLVDLLDGDLVLDVPRA